MIARKKSLLLIVLAIIIISIVSIWIYLINAAALDFDIKDLNKIEIRDGTSGNSYLLEGEEAARLSNNLLSLDVKMIGVDVWSSGYMYKVRIETNKNSEEITIKTKNIFVKGICKHEVDENIIELIEDLIETELKK